MAARRRTRPARASGWSRWMPWPTSGTTTTSHTAAGRAPGEPFDQGLRAVEVVLCAPLTPRHEHRDGDPLRVVGRSAAEVGELAHQGRTLSQALGAGGGRQAVPDPVPDHPPREGVGRGGRALLRADADRVATGGVVGPPGLPRHGRLVRADGPEEGRVAFGGREGDVASVAVAEDDGRPAIDDRHQVVHLLVDAERRPDAHRAPVAAAVVRHDPEVVGQRPGRLAHPARAVHGPVDEHDAGCRALRPLAVPISLHRLAAGPFARCAGLFSALGRSGRRSLARLFSALGRSGRSLAVLARLFSALGRSGRSLAVLAHCSPLSAARAVRSLCSLTGPERCGGRPWPRRSGRGRRPARPPRRRSGGGRPSPQPRPSTRPARRSSRR